MRRALVALALLIPALAGCFGTTVEPAPTDPATLMGGGLTLPEVPEGAEVAAIPGGLLVTFAGVPLPFESEVVIPKGTTLVRATLTVGEGEPAGVTMRHAETERRRCNLNSIEAWDVPRRGTATCSGVTAIDKLPDAWIVRATGGVPVTDPVTGDVVEPALAQLVSVELLAGPIDGPMALLDLTQLSMREHDLLPTEVLKVPSFDGTLLHVEITLPDGPGPWPTILWSSPYNHADRQPTGPPGEEKRNPAAWKYFVNDWAQRGYAVVSADVRGYGESGGCVEVWSYNEQQDQVFLVNWVAQQKWSDGNVGFYGQSYVATTPVEAAVYAPEALKAIVIVAPVNNAYDDWHFGGVPNGENTLSPVGYQQIGLEAEDDPSDPLGTVVNKGNGLCDPTLMARSSDPRAVYDAFYEERNFSARAKDVKAAVLYTQGFEDSNVKSQMIPDWFNALTVPKLGLFGHWLHQHPTRADNEVLMLGWFDQYVKGKPVGFERVPAVDVVTNAGTHRTADAWPSPANGEFVLNVDFAGNALKAEPKEGDAQLLLDQSGGFAGLLPVPIPTLLSLKSEPLAAPVHASGLGHVHLAATLENAENAYVAAYLYEDSENGSALVTWGMFNLAHRMGHDRYEPVTPGETVEVTLPLLPTEWVFREGRSLRVEFMGAAVAGWALTPPTEPAVLTLHGGEHGTRLGLPTLDGVTGVAPLPFTAQA